MIVLETENLTKKFGGLTAVNDVSMKLYQGDVLGLIGPNGAGKTTFINAITGLNPPTSGSVKVSAKMPSPATTLDGSVSQPSSATSA